MTIHCTRWMGAAALTIVMTASATAPASALVSARGKFHTSTAVVKVHDHNSSSDWRDDRGRWHRANAVRVDAPYADVENHRGHSTAVDAPFTSVRVNRGRGVWVRAPFVNLYVPR